MEIMVVKLELIFFYRTMPEETRNRTWEEFNGGNGMDKMM